MLTESLKVVLIFRFYNIWLKLCGFHLTCVKHTFLDLQKFKLIALKLDFEVLLVEIGPIDDEHVLQFVISDVLSSLEYQILTKKVVNTDQLLSELFFLIHINVVKHFTGQSDVQLILS